MSSNYISCLTNSRYWHPDNKINAQGCYYYHRNDQLVAIYEPWLSFANERSQGILTSRIIEETNTHILVVQSRSKTHEKVLWEIDWQQDGISKYQARYQVLNHELICHLGENKIVLDFPKGTSFFPLLRIFSGEVITKLANGDSTQVLVPDIRTLDSKSTILVPYKSERQAIYQGMCQIEINKQPMIVTEYEYISDIYQSTQAASCYLNKHNLLMAYQWQQSQVQCWRVENHCRESTKPC